MFAEGQGTPIVVMTLNVCFALEQGIHHQTAGVVFDDKVHPFQATRSTLPPLSLVDHFLTPFSQRVHYQALLDLTLRE